MISKRLWIFTSCSNTVFCCIFLVNDKVSDFIIPAYKLGPGNFQNATVLNSPKSRILALYSTVELLKLSISESSQGKEIYMHVIRLRWIISLSFPTPGSNMKKLSYLPSFNHIWRIKTLKNIHKKTSICLQKYSKTKREVSLLKETFCWALTRDGVQYATPFFNNQEFLTVTFCSEIWL